MVLLPAHPRVCWTTFLAACLARASSGRGEAPSFPEHNHEGHGQAAGGSFFDRGASGGSLPGAGRPRTSPRRRNLFLVGS